MWANLGLHLHYLGALFGQLTLAVAAIAVALLAFVTHILYFS